ncbi:LysM peptidoglycan-binding domain-containing protein [Streptomyces anulatus]|uniref:LysM peptidoglycan-binding domain-containing protein n=1 Tax=Streptomyces anulatus TaxID=1892 RepID=UPI002F919998
MPRTPAPLRTVGVLLRALLGLALLLALIAGAPYLLLAVGHQPTELTGGLDLLMEQDDGSLFLVVLTCLGWAGWALFTFSALVELVAVLRRRSAPRIKGLSGIQSLASFLIGGIVLLAPTAASAATSTPAVAVSTVHTIAENDATPATGTASTASADETDRPQHTVGSASELPWDLAEEYLGDGKRWKDIAALNPDIPQLAAGDQFLPKGAVVKLPADARPVAPATDPTSATVSSPPPPAETPRPQTDTARDDNADAPRPKAESRGDTPQTVTVEEGDSLWSIAGTYGDPAQWPAIYEENRGEATPGGGTFENPNLIHPGQELDIPSHLAEHPRAPESNDDQEKPAPSTPEADEPADQEDRKAAPENHEDGTPERNADKHQNDESEPAPAAPTPSTAAPTAPSPAHSTPAPSTSQPQQTKEQLTDQQRTSGEQALAPAAVWAGAGALAAALLGTVATRRILQQRRRRPGRRIPMPQGRAAATEQGLRAAQHPTGFDLLDTTLRSLARNLTAADRDLPVVHAVVLHDTKVELHLAEDTTPMKPFTAAAGRQDLWTCPASSPDLADHEHLMDTSAPYPALVSIGWDNAGHLVLIDLEHVGILNLGGGTDYARQVLKAIAIELASTPLPGHIEITALADTAPGLDEAAPERVARIATLPEAAAELASHTTDQRDSLYATGARTLGAARLTDEGTGTWTPHVVLAEALPAGADTSTLFDAIVQEPRTAGAVITAADPDSLPTSAWTLECVDADHTVVLPGSHLPIRLQGLSDEHFTDAIELLVLSSSHADVPAPDSWHQDAPDHAEDEPWTQEEELLPEAEAAGRSTWDTTQSTEHDEDGLPGEYADLDLETEDEHAAPTNLTKNPESDAPQEQTPPSLPPASDTGPSAGPADVALALSPPRSSTEPAAAPAIPEPAPAGDATIAADETTPAPDTEEKADRPPAVLLLGPISIEGARGRIDSNRLTAATELIAFLALNPGSDHHAVDDALWPGRMIGKQMRNAVISRTRSWLGKDTEGQAHLPRVQDTGDSRYRLSPAVTCDWSQFQKYARTGLARYDEDGDLALRRALALVRGRPFTGIDPQRYAWAEPTIQEMVSAIVDTAYELSERRREASDIPGALWAARRGLLAAEESEMLHRQVFLAHYAADDIDALREAASRLTRINEQLLGGVDMEAETAELLRNLLPRPVSRAR